MLPRYRQRTLGLIASRVRLNNRFQENRPGASFLLRSILVEASHLRGRSREGSNRVGLETTGRYSEYRISAPKISCRIQCRTVRSHVSTAANLEKRRLYKRFRSGLLSLYGPLVPISRILFLLWPAS